MRDTPLFHSYPGEEETLGITILATQHVLFVNFDIYGDQLQLDTSSLSCPFLSLRTVYVDVTAQPRPMGNRIMLCFA